MSISTPIQPPRRRRWWRVGLSILATLITGPIILLVISKYQTAKAWEEAEAETTALDPRWKLMEIEADRAEIPDEENSALRIIAIHRKAGRVTVTGAPKYDKIFDKLLPNAQLNKQQMDLIRGELAKIEKPLAEARLLKDFPRGRFPITFSDDWISTLLPDHQHARLMADWLMHDAYLRAQERDFDSAIESCQALLNAARSMGDDPFLIALLIRIAMQNISIVSTERVLAQGEATDARLKALQALFEREAKECMWVRGLRGERAGFHFMFENIRSGKVSPSGFRNLAGGGGGGGGGGGSIAEHALGWTVEQFPTLLLKYYPEYLQYMNRVVEACKLPHFERSPKLAELQTELLASKNLVLRLLAPALQKIDHADTRSQALLRSTAAALACERYRLAHGNWPATLDLLVKEKLLDAVPVDPIDGQPLRYRRTKEGVVVYSIGFDKTDNLGHIDREQGLNPGVDIGFRLWNVPMRRQAAPPPVNFAEIDGPQ